MYSLLVCTQSTSYHDRLNSMLADAQPKCAYLGYFRVRVSEKRQSLHIVDSDSDEERGGHNRPSGVDGDDVEVVLPLVGPS